MRKTRYYLDYAASTPIDPRVISAMAPYWTREFGNASALHSYGQKASAALDSARETMAHIVRTDFRGVIFTGSATEANNLAIRGLVRRFTQMKTQINADKNFRPRIIISAIEHESISEMAHALEQEGVEIVTIPVSRDGVVDLRALLEALNDRTVLVSIQYVNNVIGTIQPITAIAEIIRNWKLEHSKKNPITNPSEQTFVRADYQLPNYYPIFHTDAVQAFQYLDCDIEKLGVDMMTLSAHKIYGPKGVGALCIRGKSEKVTRSTSSTSSPQASSGQAGKSMDSITPSILGGGQEFGLRSGTENIPSIVGFSKAAVITNVMRQSESRRVTLLRDRLFNTIKKAIPDAELNGSIERRIPNNLHIYIPRIDARDLLIGLDLRGFALSMGSACASRSSVASPTIFALGSDEKRALSSFRITLGRGTRKKELDQFLRTLVELVKKLRM